MGFTIIGFNNDDSYFSDTDGTIVEESINYAVAYQIVDLESKDFYPNNYASREFIATTTVNALGFIIDKGIECADSSTINNK